MTELDELRERIAKALGYYWREIGRDAYLALAAGHGTVDRDAVRVDEPDAKSARHYRCPDFPRDIAAAWGLVEEINEAGYPVALLNLPAPFVGGKPFCEAKVYDKSHTEMMFHQAATAPEAICRAWLAWKEAQTKEGPQSGV